MNCTSILLKLKTISFNFAILLTLLSALSAKIESLAVGEIY